MGSYIYKQFCCPGKEISQQYFEEQQNPTSTQEDNFSNSISSQNSFTSIYKYNHFLKKFNSNLHFFGKYIDISEFNKIIPNSAKKFMIQNVLNIPNNINQDTKKFEMKPVEFKNGNIYQGNWSEKYKMDGYGQYFIKEENLFIEGIWKEGKLIFGRMFFPDGKIYEGEIKNSSFTGKGKLIFHNGDIYIGDFIDGIRTGYGKFTYVAGTIYEGEFYNGEFSGYGVMKWTHGIEYEGYFVEHTLSGFGKLVNNISCEKYEVYFFNNNFHGKGNYFFANESQYQGDFDNGKISGIGTYNVKNEMNYTGEWKNNKSDGIGQLSNSNFVIKGIWEKGINIKILDFIEGDILDLKGNTINFTIPEFTLSPKLLNNL